MLERYHAFHREVKKIFGERVDRITVNAGMTCPNIDGTRAKNGCTFCQDASYLGLSFNEKLSIGEQIKSGITYVKTRYPSQKFFAYFQNGTNTYSSPENLKAIYNEALSFPEIVGIMIATRPDCVGDEILEVLEELNKKTYLWIELGIPSHLDERNKRLNRAHSVDEFITAVTQLHQRNIRVCAHVIHGLPGETREEMIEKATFFNQFPISGIKIHNLVVFKDTVLERQYHDKLYTPLTLNDYAAWCVDFLEHLRPDILIQRLNAHGPRRVTVAPEWSINKLATINAIHQELEKRKTWQGKQLLKAPLKKVS